MVLDMDLQLEILFQKVVPVSFFPVFPGQCLIEKVQSSICGEQSRRIEISRQKGENEKGKRG